MKSQISLLNKTLLSHFNGTVFWLTIVFMALNIIALPVSIWISTFERSMYPEYQIPENFLYQVSVGQMIIGMIFVAFLAMFLLNYLNNESSSDFMHSLPIKRTSMLLHALLVGIGAIIVPLVITALIVLAERMLFIPEIAVMAIFKWLLYALFVHCVVFAIAIFTGFLVNGLFLHLQMIVLVLFLPFALWGLTYFTATVLYDGIPSSFLTYSEPVLNATFPYVAVMQLYEGISITKSIIWGIIGIVLIVLSFLLYSYRRNELVTMNFNFNWLKELLVAITTIVGMLAMGGMVSMFIPLSLTVSIIGFAIGAVISYLIIEMLFQSSVRIQFRWQTLLTTLILIALFWVVFIISWTKYVDKVPAVDEVESVYISTDYGYHTQESIDKYFEEGFLFSDNGEVIKTAVAAHEIAVNEKKMPSIYNVSDEAYLEIQYKMKDGSVQARIFDTIETNSEAIHTIDEINSNEYNIKSDFLANIKEHPEMRSLSFMTDVIELNLSLIQEYKDNVNSLMAYNPYIVNETGRIEIAAEYENAYESGESSIYNEAIISQLESKDIAIGDILYLDQTSEMYTVEVADSDIENFFKDYKELSIQKLEEAHNLNKVSEESKSDIVDQINNGELAPEGNKLLIYSYPEYIEPESINSEEDYPAELDFSILAIQ